MTSLSHYSRPSLASHSPKRRGSSAPEMFGGYISPKIFRLGRVRTAGFLIVIVSALLQSFASAQIIPNDRRTTWIPGVTVGVPGGIPTNRTKLIDVTAPPYNADKTGVLNAAPAVQAAINASSEGDVIFLPAGTYRWEGSLYVSHQKPNRTIRGAGNSTVINLVGANNFGFFGYNDAYEWKNPSSGNTIPAGSASLTQDSDTLVVENAASFAKNDLILVRLENSKTLPVVSVPTYPYMRSQLTRIVEVLDNRSLRISPRLYGDYSETAAKVNLARNVLRGFGIEDIYINAINSDGTNLIVLEQTFGCWLKGVRLHKARNRAVDIRSSLHFEMRRCYIDVVRNIGNNGAGLLTGQMCGSLIEDNIFYDAFPHIELNNSSSGNVIAYNFFELNYQGGVMGVSIDANHGAHNSFNLYEGNISSKFQSDGYYGGSSEDTLFRNWFHATCTNSNPARSTNQFGIAIFLNRFTRRYNIVGNILGRDGEKNQQYINVGAAGGYNGTSNSTVSVGTGTKVFTTQAGLNLIGCDVKISSASNPDIYMEGTVASYSGSLLTLTVWESRGSGTYSDWEFRGARGTGYGERYMLSFGLPNIGNGGYSGMAEHSRGSAHTWKDWAAHQTSSPGQGPNANGFQEYDFDVYNTVWLKGNFNFATRNIPPSETLNEAALADHPSLFRLSKPDWFGTLPWPAFDPENPGTLDYARIPAGYRFLNDSDPPPSSSSPPQFVKIKRL